MNTSPDDTLTAMWLDDELHGEELANFEAAMGQQPEMLAARAEVRRWRALMAAAVPAAEPPYPDFFNARVERAIRVPVAKPQGKWSRWWLRQSAWMPLAACAGMGFAFWLGAHTNRKSIEVMVEGTPRVVPVEPFVYTPEHGVEAERFASPPAAATVIVLSGVDAIPDDTDFSESTSRIEDWESDATAGLASQRNDSRDL